MKFYKEELNLPDIEITSVSWATELKGNQEVSEEMIKYATANKMDSHDLYPFSCVFVSTNWNGNDDVFLREEVWVARNTAKNHPVNVDHKTLDIIGHMTEVAPFTYAGNFIPDSTSPEDLVEDYDLVCNGFIYTEWNNSDREAAILEIIDGIESGKKSCSMECLFKNFDFALKSEGQIHIVPRNENTAFLTKHLRRYGGSGKYNGYQIGRVLRGISFVGKGIVESPANKRSIFIHNTQEKDAIIAKASEKFYTDVVNANMEKNMNEEFVKVQEKVDQLIQKVEALATEKENIKLSLQKTQSDLDAANQVIIDKVAALATLESEKNDALSAKQALEQKIAELEQKIAEMQSQAKLETRKNELKVAGLSDEDASAKVTLFANLNDLQWTEVSKTITAAVTASKITPETITQTVNDNSSTASITGAGTDDTNSDSENAKVSELKNTMKEFLRGKK